MLERVWRKGDPPTLLVGMQIGATTMETSMEVLPHCWWGCRLVQPQWKTVWRSSHTVGGNADWCNHNGNQYGGSPTLLVGMQIGATTMENSMEVPQKTENRVAI